LEISYLGSFDATFNARTPDIFCPLLYHTGSSGIPAGGGKWLGRWGKETGKAGYARGFRLARQRASEERWLEKFAEAGVICGAEHAPSKALGAVTICQ